MFPRNADRFIGVSSAGICQGVYFLQKPSGLNALGAKYAILNWCRPGEEKSNMRVRECLRGTV
jgi:hypothetical protein